MAEINKLSVGKVLDRKPHFDFELGTFNPELQRHFPLN